MTGYPWAYQEKVTHTDLNTAFSTTNAAFSNEFGLGTSDGTINCPIGTIIPWLANLTGTPSLPSGWALCDGVTGRPNLNSTASYLRGTTGLTGGVGGENSHTHGLVRNGNKGGQDYPPVGVSGISTDASEPPYYTILWIIKIGVI